MDTAPTAIPAFRDNYIWAVRHGDQCLVVDPGDAEPVQAYLQQHQLQLSAILVTHHHPDHVGGIAELLAEHPVPVYGPAAEQIPGRTVALHDGDRFQPEGLPLQLSVIAIPGHTLGHIAFHAADQQWLFCGDTLFAGGCGRLFEGTPVQMYHSLQRLAALPGQTQIFCAHEYTESNLTFAAAVTPDDPAVRYRLAQVKAQRQAGQITLPSRLAEEKASNPFLRSHEAPIQAACMQRDAKKVLTPVDCFAILRAWKDNF